MTIAAETPAMQADYVARLENRLEIDRVYKSDSEGLRLVEVETDDAERREMLDSDMDGIGARDTTIGILDEQVDRLQARVLGLNDVLRNILDAAGGEEPAEERLDRVRVLAAAAMTASAPVPEKDAEQGMRNGKG